jgi:hypothetical protein
METHSEAKPESLSPAPQICPGFLLRDLRVPMVNIRAKQTQFPAGAGWDAAPGAWDAGQIVQNEPNLVGSSMRNKANCPTGPGGAREISYCSGILSFHHLGPRAIGQNGPNCCHQRKMSGGSLS